MNRSIYRWVPALGIIFLCGMNERAMAHPPTEINLSYDLEKKNLHVEARHVARNPRKHFIRKIVVYQNDVEAAKRFYAWQTSASMLSADVALEAVTGDVLRVEAVCSEAGRKETTSVIP